MRVCLDQSLNLMLKLAFLALLQCLFDSGPLPLMGIRTQERFMPPRWRQPGPGLNFDGDSTVGPLPR